MCGFAFLGTFAESVCVYDRDFMAEHGILMARVSNSIHIRVNFAWECILPYLHIVSPSQSEWELGWHQQIASTRNCHRELGPMENIVSSEVKQYNQNNQTPAVWFYCCTEKKRGM